MIIWPRALLILATLASSSAFAQTYPARSVTIIAATTPGSLPDVIARAVGQRLSQKWGQSIVIENRAGGGYAIAASAVKNAPADGYTLLVSEAALYTIQPHLLKGRAAYAANDFVPVTGMASTPLAFVAHPSLEAKSIATWSSSRRQSRGPSTMERRGRAPRHTWECSCSRAWQRSN